MKSIAHSNDSFTYVFDGKPMFTVEFRDYPDKEEIRKRLQSTEFAKEVNAILKGGRAVSRRAA